VHERGNDRYIFLRFLDDIGAPTALDTPDDVADRAGGNRRDIGDEAEEQHADDTCDVGRENGALVAEDYPVPNTFTGEVNWVEIDVDAAAADADHRIDPDELFRVAMARQ
jgi:hypothetical protein